jgi:hypothetical protein
MLYNNCTRDVVKLRGSEKIAHTAGHWTNTVDFGYLTTPLSVYRFALFIVILNGILVGNLLGPFFRKWYDLRDVLES